MCFFFLHIDSLLKIGERLCQKFCVSAIQLMDTAIATAEFSTQALAQLFLLRLQKIIIDIFITVFLYSCDVHYHTISYWCFSMGPGISKATLLHTESWPCLLKSVTHALLLSHWRFEGGPWGAQASPVTSKIAKLMWMSCLIFTWWLFTWLDNCLNVVMSSLANDQSDVVYIVHIETIPRDLI